MKHHTFTFSTTAALLLAATLGVHAQPILVTNSIYSAGLSSYDFGPGLVTISAFFGETELTPNAAINSGNLSFLGVNSELVLAGDPNVNSINDRDGVSGGADQDRLRLEIASGYYLTNLTWAWSRADGPLTNDGVRISGFLSDPGASFSGGISSTPIYTNGTLTFQITAFNGTVQTVWFTNYAASAGATLEITVADSTQAGAQFTSRNFTLAEVPPPTPTITQQPLPATRYVQDGTNVFSVAALGAGTLGYQWYKSPSSAIADATNTSLTLPSLALTDAGDYYVVVTNITLGTSSTSDTVALTVNPWVAPSFLVSPVSTSAYIHQTVNFTAEATGSPAWSLSYQWNKAGTPIPGATNATLTLTDISVADGVSYTCTASNGVGSPATSGGALLTVLTPTAGSYAAAAIDSKALIYHRYSDVASSTNVLNQGTLGAAGNGDLSGFYSPAGGPQPPEYPNFEVSNPAAGFDGFSANGSIPPLGAMSNRATIAAWIRLDYPQVPNAGIVYHRAPGAACGLFVKKDSTQTYDVLGYVWNNQRFGITNDTLALPLNRWAFAALVIEPNQATLYLQDGTNMITQVDTFNHTPATFSATTLVGWDNNGSLTDRRFAGQIDEVTIHNRSLSPSEVLTLFAASSNYPPTIVTSPQDTTNYTGKPFSLTVAAQGTPPMKFQWYKQGSGAVSGATNASYSVASATVGDSGGYYVVVTNAINSATSGVANVTILAQSPILTSIPESVTNWLGLNATFSVVADGSAPLSYQWAKVGTGDLAGETNTTLELTDLVAGDAGDYRVTVTNPEGATNSPLATLLVVNPNLFDQMLFLTNGHGTLRSNFTGNIGTRFLMGDYDRTVTHLGFFDADADGLTQAHSVGVYTLGDPAGTGVLLGGVQVPAGTAAGYTNGYRWVDLSTPITLTNGQTYVIAANTAQNVDAWPGEWRADFNEVFVGYTALTNRVLVYAPQAAWPTEPSIPVLNNLGSTYGAYNLMSVASATPEVMLTIEKVGANVRLTWPIGVLQQAGAVNGTYTNVPAATSPYTNAASAQQMFFRVKVN